MIKSSRREPIIKSIRYWIEGEMTDEIKEDVYDFFRTSTKYHLSDIVTLRQFKTIMFRNGFDDQSYMWKESVKSAYTREDYDRFDENGEFIPYKPTEEELAKKDEIKKVLKQELSDAHEPDPMDHYTGYDTTDARVDMACERVAKQFGVDTDFVEEIAGEIEYELWVDGNKEWDWVNTPGNLTSEQYDQYMNGELDVKPLMLKSSKKIQSGISNITFEKNVQDYALADPWVTVTYDYDDARNSDWYQKSIHESIETAKEFMRKGYKCYIDGVLIDDPSRFDSESTYSMRVVKSSKAIKSDAASEQKLKEDLIRQGYTEDEANQIIGQRKPQDVQSEKKLVKSVRLVPHYSGRTELPFTNYNGSSYKFEGIRFGSNGVQISGYAGGPYASESTMIDVFDNGIVNVYDSKHHIDMTRHYDKDKIREFVEFFKET